MSSANRCTNLSKEREIVMPRFFLEELDESDVCITGPDARHIGLSLRMRVGEMLTVCAYGRDYQCRIRSITPEEVHLDVVSSELCAAEPTVALTLYQAVPKADKLEQIIKHGVELGAAHVVPFFSRYCVAAPKKEEQKNERYNRIAFEAAKQCGRGILPDVALPLPNFGAVCRSLDQYDLVLFCYELGGAPLRQLLADAQPADGQRLKIALITGAEGGFAAEEAEMAAKAGAKTVGLGPRILRCETAPLAVLSAVMILTGNLE